MGLDRLWAGWRSAYIDSITTNGDADTDPGGGPTAAVPKPPPGEGTLFERILRLDDADGYIVRRGATCSVVLNAYPYASGHALVLPNRGVADLAGLGDDAHAELWSLVRDTVAATRAAYSCDGVNVGMNLGQAAGAGVPDHLHVHVLPRWAGDSNFMTSVAEARVMPEPLGVSWQKLRAAWPTDAP